MSRKAFFWFEFSILVGGSVIMFLGDHSYGLVLGAALVGLGGIMFCLSLIRSRTTTEPLGSEASRMIRK